MVFTGINEKMMMEFKDDIMEKYEMSDLELLHNFLGMGVIQGVEGSSFTKRSMLIAC